MNTDDAEKSLSSVDGKAEGVGRKLLDGIGTAAKWGAGIAMAAGAGAAALFGVANSAAATADEIDKMSQKLGISREAYQELDFVLSQNGMDVNSLQGGMKTLVNTMQAAQEGSASAASTFDALGIAVTNADGSLRNQEDVFFDTIAALQSMENETERNALANDIFGKSATEMIPLLNAGAGSMEELRQKAHELGLVMDDEAVDAGVAFTDSMDQLKRSFEAIVTQVGVKVMPIFQAAADWVIEHMPQIQAVVGAAFDAIGFVVGIVGDLIGWLAGIFEQYMPAIQDFAVTAFGAIAEFWETNLKPCLEAIGGFIGDVLVPAFAFAFGFIAEYVGSVFATIGNLWEGGLKPIFTGIIDFITGVFTGNWSQAFQGLVSIVGGIFGGLVAIVKAPINSVIGIINGFIGGLNKLTIPDWIPVIGGNGVNIPSIPYLAKGGVLERGQVGYLEGTGAEAVVPLENNAKWIQRVANDMDGAMGGGETVRLLQAILDALNGIDGSVYVDGRELSRSIAGHMDRELGKRKANAERGRGLVYA